MVQSHTLATTVCRDRSSFPEPPSTLQPQPNAVSRSATRIACTVFPLRQRKRHQLRSASTRNSTNTKCAWQDPSFLPGATVRQAWVCVSRCGEQQTSLSHEKRKRATKKTKKQNIKEVLARCASACQESKGDPANNSVLQRCT